MNKTVKRHLFLLSVFIISLSNVYADSVLTMEIHNVTINGGIIYVSVFFNEQSYKNKTADMIFPIDPADNVLQMEGKIPGNFHKLKITMDTSNRKIIIPLVEY